MLVKLIFLIASLFCVESATAKQLPKPSPGKESIEEAIKRFAIQIPENAMIVYSAERNERAITMPPLDGSGVFVIVGPGAFTSWALLGSTLGHELEVHARQDIAYAQKRTDSDLPGGLYLIEVEAYLYEIKNKDRFGTSEDELNRYVRLWLKDYIQLELAVWKRLPSKQFFMFSVKNNFSALLD